jgi:predicted AlkP superfamily pyrophosphatase or phosphodiesterase
MQLRELATGLLFGVMIAAGAHAAEIERALLVSVDGLHALDVARFIKSHPNSAMAELARHGITYTNARTPANSDSFPGLLALVTGGSPLTHGLFYDVSYDRSYFDPTNTTCSGVGAGNTMVFDESIDLYDTSNPGRFVSKNVIDPSKLPRRLNASNQCVAVYPHDAIKTNTIFEVVKARGGVTAWADKHPAYDLVNGPSGTGVDDLYTPEVTNVGGLDNTVSVVCTAENDQLKVQGVLNQIHGKKHDGSPARGVPTVFGMNFQAVSVGQKLTHETPDPSCLVDAATTAAATTLSTHTGGYLDGSGTPTDVLNYGLEQTDAALASMIDALKAEGLYESTLFVVTAKHGQSPINRATLNKPGHFADLVAALPVPTDSSAAAAQAAIATANACGTGPCGFVQDDDIALIWLADQTQTPAVAAYLNQHVKNLFIDEVLAGSELKLRFNDPQHDNRTPDVIVQPNYGVVYTGSTKKDAEHGGFSFADTNLGLIVSNPSIRGRVVKSPVATSQVAATILQALEIDPNELESVRVEGTKVLPGLSQH